MASASSSGTLSVNVSYRGTTHQLSFPPDTSLARLETELELLTGVPPSMQKLLYKGKKPPHGSGMTISQAGIKNGMKLQLLGTTAQELDGMVGVENEKHRRERIMKERALKPQTKLRSTGMNGSIISTLSSPAFASSTQFKFHNIKSLPHLPDPATAQAILAKAAEDPAIRHIMHKHQYAVGLLTELAPHEHPNLLGLNVNKGEAIKLRIRTDRYDGFRVYKEIRRVLCHELAHNVWGDHDSNFKELNSQLNREVAEYERAALRGTHYLTTGPSDEMYQASSELEAEAKSHILGGDTTAPIGDESVEERRRRVLEATMSRLRQEEEELEHSCGTGQSI